MNEFELALAKISKAANQDQPWSQEEEFAYIDDHAFWLKSQENADGTGEPIAD